MKIGEVAPIRSSTRVGQSYAASGAFDVAYSSYGSCCESHLSGAIKRVIIANINPRIRKYILYLSHNEADGFLLIKTRNHKCNVFQSIPHSMELILTGRLALANLP